MAQFRTLLGKGMTGLKLHWGHCRKYSRSLRALLEKGRRGRSWDGRKYSNWNTVTKHRNETQDENEAHTIDPMWACWQSYSVRGFGLHTIQNISAKNHKLYLKVMSKCTERWDLHKLLKKGTQNVVCYILGLEKRLNDVRQSSVMLYSFAFNKTVHVSFWIHLNLSLITS